ncbi:MAG TPA: serine/threonine-protein kinase, partial [Acidobacteriota bacterium]|nr:serine/threonine-protein kinase [Acidobacteriota bacterium]
MLFYSFVKPLPEKIGKYKIDSLLGRGGMGQVYKAHDPSLDRYVALKIMGGPALDDTSARERFIREGQAAGGLRHPNIVTVYDLGDVDGQMFIAMELIGGHDLEQIIRSKTALSIEDKLNIMIQVCEGISYAHKRDVVHRDLKPSNIRIDDEGIAKIMDFGIAKLGSSTMTATGTV